MENAKIRIEKILNKMVEVISNISLLTTGTMLTESDILCKAERKCSKN
jgi:hypothetical protein